MSLDSPELAIKRVATRVQQGGHYIPDDVVRRRFATGITNFNNIYKLLVDKWMLFNNSSSDIILLDKGVNNG